MRVKGGGQRRKKHKKTLKQAKGYRLTRSKLYKRAKESVLHSGQYSRRDRKHRKAQMRKVWIQRITAALSQMDLKYSRFIAALKDKNIELNRKMLSEIAVHDFDGFTKIVEAAGLKK